MSLDAFEQILARNSGKAEQIRLEMLRFRLIESCLRNGRAYVPFWEMHATRLDQDQVFPR